MTPRTPRPSPAITCATIGCGNGVLGEPLCPQPLTMFSAVATGAKVIGVVALTLFGVRAATVTVRRANGATSRPVASIGTAAGSLVVQER